MVQEGTVALENQDITPVDTLSQSDSISTTELPVYGIILTPPQEPEAAPLRPQNNIGVSFILGGLFVLWLIVALRFRNNFKYAVTLIRNLVETRTRQNVFDDTVRETSLIVLLNILWCACAGIVGYCVYTYYTPDSIVLTRKAVAMLSGMGIAGIYTIFLIMAYGSVGWVFTDSNYSKLWVKGYTTSQALMAPAFFLTALIGLCRPDSAPAVGILSAGVFIFAKLLFIWKGYRIFFNQFSSWVLFLCYLCSLEIVPLILCYRCAILLGDVL